MAEESQHPATAAGAEQAVVSPQIDDPMSDEAAAKVHLPRIMIRYCTQCNWMLKAAYVRTACTTFFVHLFFPVAVSF
jgi:hypothetical protein